MDVTEALNYLGEFGFFQFYVFILSCFPAFISGIIMLSNVFLMGIPQHRCYIDGCDTSNQTFDSIFTSFTVPKIGNILSSCQRYVNSNKTTICSSEYFSKNITDCEKWIYDKDHDFQQTIVTEWDLVCDQRWKIPFSQSIFMVGVLFGAILFGYLADKYGRRTIFYWAPVILQLSILGSSFSPNFLTFTILSALISSCCSGMFQTAFILGQEFVGPVLRTWCGNIQQIVFALGELFLCILAYLLRDWRELQFSLNIPIASLLFLPWFLPESVLWQASHHKSHKAFETIKEAAKMNRIELPDELLLKDKHVEKKERSLDYGMLDIIKHPILSRWSFNLFFNWSTNSLVYYGLSLQASTLGSNPYITFGWLAAVEIPAIILTTLCMQFFGRRSILCATELIGGLACLVPLLLSKNYYWLIPYLAVVGKGAISASFSLIYIYSIEIYPTVLRSTGLGMCSMFSRIGAILAPQLTDLKVFGDLVPLYVCGGFCIASGLFTFDLPETKDLPLPESLEDVERLKCGFSIIINETINESYNEFENLIAQLDQRNTNETQQLLKTR